MLPVDSTYYSVHCQLTVRTLLRWNPPVLQRVSTVVNLIGLRVHVHVESMWSALLACYACIIMVQCIHAREPVLLQGTTRAATASPLAVPSAQ